MPQNSLDPDRSNIEFSDVEQQTRRLPPTWRRTGELKIRFLDGPRRGEEITLKNDGGQSVRGGRSLVNEIVLGDEHVSGVHFDLAIDPNGGVLLRDLGSCNGVYLNTARIKEAWIGPGHTFSVGGSTLQLLSADPVAVPLSARDHFGELHGASLVMRELFAKLERFARVDRLPILLTGETGTGKELVARALHDHSPRARAPYIAVNCAAIPAHLAEAQFFGHRKGSFTGATEERSGYFEDASGGTLFLDEIGELPLDLQPKLLRTLQEGEVCRVGDTRPRKVDVRVISATHRDLRRMVADNDFREDLYFRLAANRVNLPALRERSEDIIPLAERFLARLADQGGGIRALTLPARTALRAHPWPGNVRELRNVIERAYFMVDGDTIAPSDLLLDPWSPREQALGLTPQIFDRPLKDAREEFERAYLRRLLASEGALVAKAKRAGITEEGLRLARKRLRLDPLDPL